MAQLACFQTSTPEYLNSYLNRPKRPRWALNSGGELHRPVRVLGVAGTDQAELRCWPVPVATYPPVPAIDFAKRQRKEDVALKFLAGFAFGRSSSSSIE
jgi:hypothetical protein